METGKALKNRAKENAIHGERAQRIRKLYVHYTLYIYTHTHRDIHTDIEAHREINASKQMCRGGPHAF